MSVKGFIKYKRNTKYTMNKKCITNKQRKHVVKRNSTTDISYTYIVECGDGSLYTGWTNHLEERMKCHNEGRGAKYTRSRLPVRLVHYEEFATKQEAMKREYAIKQLPRKDKLMLIEKQSVKVRKRCARIASLALEFED